MRHYFLDIQYENRLKEPKFKNESCCQITHECYMFFFLPEKRFSSFLCHFREAQKLEGKLFAAIKDGANYKVSYGLHKTL